jgi:hypothetical protein
MERRDWEWLPHSISQLHFFDRLQKTSEVASRFQMLSARIEIQAQHLSIGKSKAQD